MKSLHRRFSRYSKLLYLYPVSYRKEYGEQMLQTLADMLDDPQQPHASTWLRLTLDFPLSVLKQQVMYTGEVMATAMPTYIKRNALIGAGLVAPFFTILIINGLLGNRLQSSWLWQSWVLFVWLVLLPALAVAANLSAWIRWARAAHAAKQNMWRILTDFRLSWPALTMMVLGVGILGLVFFHDSVHCIAGNPVRELHNPSQTWHCIEQQ